MESNKIYIPAAFTLLNAYLGMLGAVYAYQNEWNLMFFCMLGALLADGIDGKIARLTHSTSPFGKELDSLADVITFGAATSFIVFLYVGQHYGQPGLILSCVVVLSAAVRLAKFNVDGHSLRDVFVGLPSPAASFILISFIALSEQFGLKTGPVLLLLCLIVSFLMVSHIYYPKITHFNILKRNQLKIAVILIPSLLMLISNPYPTLFFLMLAYVIFGPLLAFNTYSKKQYAST